MRRPVDEGPWYHVIVMIRALCSLLSTVVYVLFLHMCGVLHLHVRKDTYRHARTYVCLFIYLCKYVDGASLPHKHNRLEYPLEESSRPWPFETSVAYLARDDRGVMIERVTTLF